MGDPASEYWHFDRRIPLALIVVFVGQFAGGVWYTSTLANDVKNNKEKIQEIRRKTDAQDKSGRDISDRLIRVEIELKNGNKLLQELVNEKRRQNKSPNP